MPIFNVHWSNFTSFSLAGFIGEIPTQNDVFHFHIYDAPTPSSGSTNYETATDAQFFLNSITAPFTILWSTLALTATSGGGIGNAYVPTAGHFLNIEITDVTRSATFYGDEGGYTMGTPAPPPPPPPPGVPCFVKGTRVLTTIGYKPIEDLGASDVLMTSDMRETAFRVVDTTIDSATATTAPYIIPAHTFGRNQPASPLYLSPTHKFMIKKGVWTDAQTASEKYPGIHQYGVGKPVNYYHILCEDYLRDNVVAEGLITESLGTKTYLGGKKTVYTWSEKLGGYTRVGVGSLATLPTLL